MFTSLIQEVLRIINDKIKDGVRLQIYQSISHKFHTNLFYSLPVNFQTYYIVDFHSIDTN